MINLIIKSLSNLINNRVYSLRISWIILFNFINAIERFEQKHYHIYTTLNKNYERVSDIWLLQKTNLNIIHSIIQSTENCQNELSPMEEQQSFAPVKSKRGRKKSTHSKNTKKERR